MKLLMLLALGAIMLTASLGARPSFAVLVAPDALDGGGKLVSDPIYDLTYKFGTGAGTGGGGATKGSFALVGGNEVQPFDAVNGHVDDIDSCVDCAAILSGTATVRLGGGSTLKNVPYCVEVQAGGPGEGALTITLEGVLDNAPGDQIPGNGDYDGPTLNLAAGMIKVRGTSP